MRRTLRPATVSVAWVMGLWAVSGLAGAAEPSGHRGIADVFKGQAPPQQGASSRPDSPRSREGLREPSLRVADNSGPAPGAVRPAGGEVTTPASPTSNTPASPTSNTPHPAAPAVNEHPLEPVLKMAYRGLEEMN